MVLLTRERGKNDKMLAELRKHSIAALELPLIQHSDGPDRARLPAVIKQGGYDWVAITSPEAASVFLDAWQEAGQPRVRMAVVGSGTGEVLQQAGLTPDYTSSKANGKTLGSELPKVPGGSNVVLFPASAKAGTDLQEGLSASGFTVNRLSTYNTSGVDSVDAALLQQALQAPIVTFGSPSAVK